MERKQNEGTEKIIIKVAQTLIIFMDFAWLTDCFCSRFFCSSMLQQLLTGNVKVDKVVSCFVIAKSIFSIICK